jgi:hypothetical protein
MFAPSSKGGRSHGKVACAVLVGEERGHALPVERRRQAEAAMAPAAQHAGKAQAGSATQRTRSEHQTRQAPRRGPGAPAHQLQQ